MYRTALVIIVFISFNACLNAQASIDFYPKLLKKELSKTNGENMVLNELCPPPNVVRQILLGKFYSVSGNSTTSPTIKYVYIGRVNTCRAGGCSIDKSLSNDKVSEFFDYFIFFDSGCAVQRVKIYNYQATHGQEVTAKGWLKQFHGYNGNTELLAGKNIDAISGATISVDATTFDIEHKTGLLKQTVNK